MARKWFISLYIGFLITVISFVLLEILIRIIISSNYVPLRQLRKAHLYGSYYSDDDFWKLDCIFEKYILFSQNAIHPLLGWSQVPIEDNNPLGLRKDNLELFSYSKKHILFYGDSFVAGVGASPDYKIPNYITKRLNDAVIIDLGCGGYGFDQMYLLFLSTHTKVHEPFVIFGILVEDDLDRSILSVRGGQKPYFIVQNEKLVLQGIPIDSSPMHYFATHPPQIKSYAFRLFFRATIGKTEWCKKHLAKTDKKILVNTKIIEEIYALCKAKGYPLLFVLFHGQGELAYGGYWQEKFLKDIFNRKNIPYIDTGDFLRKYSQQYGVKLSDFYLTEGNSKGHHNDLGNRIIAEGLLEFLSREYAIERKKE